LSRSATSLFPIAMRQNWRIYRRKCIREICLGMINSQKQTMKKILVTGAAGFIGFHLSKVLLEQGYEVVGLDNINDYNDVKLKYPRLVAQTGVRYSLENPIAYVDRNAVGFVKHLNALNYQSTTSIQVGVKRFVR